MRETVKNRIITLMKQVKFPAFPGGTPDVSVEHQLPEHAFEAIADHLANNGITSLPHIKLVEATQVIGSYKMEKIILFNDNRITEEEATRYAEADEYNANVVVLEKAQWIMLFRDGIPMD